MSGLPKGLTAAIFGLKGPRLTPGEAAFFRDSQPFGFILFARNIESPDQLRRLTGDLRSALGWHLPILIDQEGGRVQRLGPPHWRAYLPPLEAATRATALGGADAATRMVYLRHRLIAAELLALGINVNCAPCLDIAFPETHPFLQNRCWGRDAESVTRLGRAAAQGLMAGGVLPVIKHLPGHGRAAQDSHLRPARVTAPEAVLKASDFAPFAALAGLPMAMTSHVIYSALDPRPATLSAPLLAHLRAALGFDGLLLSDDLNMKALRGSAAARSAGALAAGCDIALFCKGDLGTLARVAAAVGPLAGAARRRAEAALAAQKPPEAVDIKALAAEHARLLGEAS